MKRSRIIAGSIAIALIATIITISSYGVQKTATPVSPLATIEHAQSTIVISTATVGDTINFIPFITRNYPPTQTPQPTMMPTPKYAPSPLAFSTVIIGAAIISPSQIVIIPIFISRTAELESIELWLAYDRDVIAVLDVWPGGAISGTHEIVQFEDSFYLESDGLRGDNDTLALVRIVGIGYGVSPIAPYNQELPYLYWQRYGTCSPGDFQAVSVFAGLPGGGFINPCVRQGEVVVK